MEALFEKTGLAFSRKMHDIENEMLEEYGSEYTDSDRHTFSGQAIRLLVETFGFVKQMIPYYRSTNKMMEQLAFVGETGECRYLAGTVKEPSISYLMFQNMEERQRKNTVLYAARWLEYYYRVYEKAKQPVSMQNKVKEQLERIVKMQPPKKEAVSFMPGMEETMKAVAATLKPVEEEIVYAHADTQFPIRLYRHLDSYVVGQDDVKKSISMAVHQYMNHGMRNNILMIGPSGSGKNYITQILSEFPELESEMVVYVHDASSLTPNGFQGGNVADIFKEFNNLCRLKNRSNKKGIIYLDEIDKIIYPNTDSNGENVNAIVQRQLLAAIEGTTVISGVDTGKILFILGGAFELLHDREKERAVKNRSKVGFLSQNSSCEDVLKESCTLKDDLIAVGAQKEFLGRLPIVVRMNRLGKEELKKILLHEKTGVIRQKQKVFAKDGLKLVVEEEVYDLLAEKMYEEDLGARSARNMMEQVIGTYHFDMLLYGYHKMIIHPGVILRKEKPYFERREERGRKPVRNAGTLKSCVDRIAV